MSTTSISITWCIEDVLDVRPDLSNEPAGVVLDNIKRNHDATIGVNWDVIAAVADLLFKEA